LRRPYGADRLLLALFPTLKRGANDRCASGAIEIGTSVVNKMGSSDCPEWGRVVEGASPWVWFNAQAGMLTITARCMRIRELKRVTNSAFLRILSPF